METNCNKINRDKIFLAPFMLKKLEAAMKECHELGYPIEIFEGYRSPERQDWLYAQGRTRDGKIVTNAKAFESWHNFGLAVDLVFLVNGKWDWSGDFDKIEQVMLEHGFTSLKFERCHFQINGGMSIRKAANIAKQGGLMALWSIIENSLKYD